MHIGSPFTIYENPAPLLVSRQALFPGIVQLPNHDLLAMFSIGQAFDAADMRAYTIRSGDMGKTWSGPQRVSLQSDNNVQESESFKPLVLADGSLLALGYVFIRPNDLIPIVDPETLALLPLRSRVSHSNDLGVRWSEPQSFSVGDAPLELSGPPIQLASGRLLAAAAPFHLDTKGHEGWIIASDDLGQNWTRQSIFFREGQGEIAPWECRLTSMGDDRVAVMFWAYDNRNRQNLNNRLVISDDGGRSFGEAIDIGVKGQASNLFYLGNNRLLTIHCHREAPVGLIVREFEVTGNAVAHAGEWPIFSSSRMQSRSDNISDQFGSLKFGQPSLLQTHDGAVLAAWWQVENCQYVIKGCWLDLSKA